jgi:hypothetical protein
MRWENLIDCSSCCFKTWEYIFLCVIQVGFTVSYYTTMMTNRTALLSAILHSHFCWIVHRIQVLIDRRNVALKVIHIFNRSFWRWKQVLALEIFDGSWISLLEYILPRLSLLLCYQCSCCQSSSSSIKLLKLYTFRRPISRMHSYIGSLWWNLINIGLI